MEGTNKIEILPRIEKQAETALYQTQVSNRSPIGAIIYETGGGDDAWVRILGSGNDKLDRTLPIWNTRKTFNEFEKQPSVFLIADDVVGGFFEISGGGLGIDLGNVYYFAPDSLEWESLGFRYSVFFL